jgi:hypothetical protein
MTQSKKPAPLIAVLLSQATRIERPTGKPMVADFTALDASLANAIAIADDAGQVVTALDEILAD